MTNRPAEYMLYWQERSVQEHASNDLPLDVIASNQLFRVRPGDVIWIVTLTQERELVLAGRMSVDEIVEYEEAIRRMPDAGLWQAEYYAFPEPETEEYLREIDIQHLAEDLRFDSENDRLILREGKINPQQMQSMRKLTRESAEMLEEAFYSGLIDSDEQSPEVQVELFRAQVELDPLDAVAHYNLGVALGLNDMDEEAVASFERALEIDPNYFPAQYNLGNTMTRLGRFEEAIESLNKAILIEGEYAPAHFMLGVAYYGGGRYEDAVAATRQGLEIDPDDQSAYHNIAFWTYERGDYRRAIGFCDDAIARFPYSTRPHVIKGMCFRELGELDNEIQSYRS
ncbi:MAG: tetratricopeptide repeat protein, partial [Acidobacteria bacterium]|nr:tetratricopeptide repeat protein [Acidobacteriota bacterium]